MSIINAENLKDDLKKQLTYSCYLDDVNKIVDEQPTVATELDEIAGGSIIHETNLVISFSKEWLMEHLDEAIKYLHGIVKEGADNAENAD